MQKVLYGFEGARDSYRCARSFVFFDEPSVYEIRKEIALMRMRCPSIARIYLLDNRHGLRRELAESLKKSTVESLAIFLDTCQYEGIRVF